ncbi:MAG: LysM peptidoglycan-binding domain-containing protein [Ornithinimicrobium sp.]
MSATSWPTQAPSMRRPTLYLAGGTDLDAGFASDPSMVLTRRGRLMRTASILAVVIIVVAVAWTLMGPANAGTQVVVQPGQTLSEIAATELPHLSLDRAMVEVQLANQMNTLHVQAGQTLVIP